MSYDISFVDKDGGPMVLQEPHHLRGGTYVLGGTGQAWLNITYNYSPFYYRLIDPEKGIRALYGKTGAEAKLILDAAILQMGVDPPSEDYWEPTEGNARKALEDLCELCRRCPEGILEGD